MHVPHNSVVLVTDGCKRLFLRNEGDALAPRLTVILAAEDADPRIRQQATDSPDQAVSVTRGGVFPVPDARELEEQRFTAETAAEPRRAALTGEYDRLIVMAPPKTLGQLRKNYHVEVEKRILREIAKDMTDHPVDQIEKMLIDLD